MSSVFFEYTSKPRLMEYFARYYRNTVRELQRAPAVSRWVAVKELKISYHNMCIQVNEGFPYNGNLV